MNEVLRIHEAASSYERTRVAATTVSVQGVRVEARIGAHEHERQQRQLLVIDVDLRVRPVGLDKLEHTFNYERIAELSASLCDNHIDLIETFAFRLASMCLQDAAVLAAEVSIAKPDGLANGIPRVKVALQAPSIDTNFS